MKLKCRCLLLLVAWGWLTAWQVAIAEEVRESIGANFFPKTYVETFAQDLECDGCEGWPTADFREELRWELGRAMVDDGLIIETDRVYDSAETKLNAGEVEGHRALWEAITNHAREQGSPLTMLVEEIPLRRANGSVATSCGAVSYRYLLSAFMNEGVLHTKFELAVSGDCACREVGGKKVGAFELNLSRDSRLGLTILSNLEGTDEEPYLRRFVYNNKATKVGGSCKSTVDCECPDEASGVATLAGTATEGVIEGGFVTSGQQVSVVFEPIPLNSAVSLAGTAQCTSATVGGLTRVLADQPCYPQATSYALSALEQIAAELPGAIEFSGGDRFKAAADVSDVDLATLIQSYLDASLPEEESAPSFLKNYEFAGTVQLACGSVDYRVRILRSMDSGSPPTMFITLHNDACQCADGNSVAAFSGSYEVQLSPVIAERSANEVRVALVPTKPHCSFALDCCAPPANDYLPLTGFEFAWDTSAHCTHGGASTPLDQLFKGAVQNPIGSTIPNPQSGQPSISTTTGASSPVAGSDTASREGRSVLVVPPTVQGADESDSRHSPLVSLDEEPQSTPGSRPDPPLGGSSTSEVQPDDSIPEPSPQLPDTAKATKVTLSNGLGVAVQGAQVAITWEEPLGDGKGEDAGHDEPQYSGLSNDGGEVDLAVPDGVSLPPALSLEADETTGLVLVFDTEQAAITAIDPILATYLLGPLGLRSGFYQPLAIPTSELVGEVKDALDSAVAAAQFSEVDACGQEKPLANSYFTSSGSWSQAFADQWAIHRVGFTPDGDDAWQHVRPADEAPTVVAVIDTGLDWNHLEINWDTLWRNPGEVFGNGIDDDGNGYIDDTIGWDFWDNDRSPWDVGGHGTFVSGVMFADPHNDQGIVGISRHARLMVLKAMNGFGHTRASAVAKAIIYAVDNGAHVINLSLGGPTKSKLLERAIEYAAEHDVVVVVAAGNEAVHTDGQMLAGLPSVITVAASNAQDKRALYSNYGSGIDVTAPGNDVLSIRARRTDILKDLPGVEYAAESAFVGSDRRYYRASGTSFAAPIVAGVAALLRANDPTLSAPQIARMIRQSAEDIEVPGVDHFSGYGLLDAHAALRADPEFYIRPYIGGVQVVAGDQGQALQVLGSAQADQLKSYSIDLGAGDNPSKWRTVAEGTQSIDSGALAQVPVKRFAGEKVWTIRLLVTHENGRSREYRFRLELG